MVDRQVWNRGWTRINADKDKLKIQILKFNYSW